ncbi:MAG TPA: hypothetical protein VHI75_08845 [Casimicrobiaceae bacterium]|nr:hypothetical protein [Casimicrobiaceae bacterium]
MLESMRQSIPHRRKAISSSGISASHRVRSCRSSAFITARSARRNAMRRRKGLHAQAIAALQKYVDLSGRASDALMRLGCAYATSGDEDSASKLLDELRSLARRQYVSPGTIAALDVALGNKERALMALEAGVSKRSASLLMLAADPVFDPLRSEPRFQTLLQCIGLPS